MPVELKVIHPHALGRMEAKRRIDKGVDELVDRLGLVEKWTDNVATLTGSGQSEGFVGTATVRNNNVEVVLSIPDARAEYVPIYRTNLENALIQWLGPPAA